MKDFSSLVRSVVQRVQSVSFTLGFELRRVPRLTQRDELPPFERISAGRSIIELIGTSGVGKSEFLKYLQETSTLEDEFLVLPRKFRVQFRPLSKHRWNESDRRWLELWAQNRQIKGLPPVHPCDLDAEGAKALRDERTMRNLETSHHLIVDHSLALFFNRALRACADNHRELFDDLMFRRAVVVCRADPITILHRIRQRAASGTTRRFHAHKSDEELLERIRRGNNDWERYGEWLASKGIPVLVLDLDSPLEASKAKLQEFVRSLG